MFGFKRSDYDKKVYQEELLEFLPKNIVDCHTHIHEPGFRPPKDGPKYWPHRVAEHNPIDDLVQTYKDLFPENKVIPVVFGTPSAILSINNPYASQKAKEYNYPCLYCTHYDMEDEFLEREVISGGFQGLKPYCINQRAGVKKGDAEIYDFLPERHLKLADKYGWKVMLHISKPDRLKNPDNVRQLMEIDEKYPNAKVIVAHVGRAYSVEDVGDAFETLKHSKNLLFDFSANTLSYAITKCIEAVGTKRVMFGTDLPIAKMRMVRITENGDYINVVPKGLYGDLNDAKHMREIEDGSHLTNFAYEILRAFKKTAKDLILTKKDVEDVMCNNASNLFGIKF